MSKKVVDTDGQFLFNIYKPTTFLFMFGTRKSVLYMQNSDLSQFDVIHYKMIKDRQMNNINQYNEYNE